MNPKHFLILFIIGYVLMHILYFLIPDSFLLGTIYRWVIVLPSVAAINLLSPQEGVHGVASAIVSGRASLEVVRGCDGSGAIFLLSSAILAFPSRWRAKLLGFAGGFLLVYGLNQVRIIGLYFVEAYRKDWFTLLHVYLAPTLVVIVSALYFVSWAIRQHVSRGTAANGNF